MKKTFLVAAIIGLMVGGNITYGQAGSCPRPHAENHMNETPKQKAAERTEKMTKDLGLTADQSKKVGEINFKHAEEMEILHKQMKELKEQAKAKKEAYNKEIDSLLTEEQRLFRAKKIQEQKDKRKANDCERGCQH